MPAGSVALAYIHMYETDAALLATTGNVIRLSDVSGEGYISCMMHDCFISDIGLRCFSKLKCDSVKNAMMS